MSAVTPQEMVLFAGLAIVALALLQVTVMLFSTMRRASVRRQQHRMELAVLRSGVNAAAASSQIAVERASHSWNGTRKFRIERKHLEGGDICSFYLVPHDGKELPPFEPGQYLTFNLRIPGLDKPIIRCYSLSDGPERATEYYRVSIKKVPPPRGRDDVPPGLSSNFFHGGLNEGDILDVKAPGGHFYLDMGASTPVVLIGGGVGITPVLSMLNAICASGSKRETWFFYGVRNGDEHVFREHLEQIDRDNENVHLVVCYSDPRDTDEMGRDYQHGERVSVELFRRLLPSNNYDFYMCGPPPMMETVRTDLADWGVAKDNIHFEAFGAASVRKPRAEAAAEPAATPITISFAKSGKKLAWNAGAESLLEFAEDNGVTIDSGCRAGNCGTCITAVKSGEVTYLSEPGADPEDGSCLTCISIPKSDLTLEA